VADEGRGPGRLGAGARSGARIGAGTWPLGGSRRPWAAAWPRPEFAVPARLREWALAEVGAGRLLPWFAVAFGAGIVLYFTAEREPVWWAPSAVAAGAAVAAVLLRRRPLAFVMALGLFALAAGFAVATLKAVLIEHPVLRYPASSVSIAGFVELREESQKTDRFVLRVVHIEGSRILDKPQRVRLSVRRGLAPPAGAFVELKAQLNPPLQPLRPGSYDFARDLYFQRIGASGFVRGRRQDRDAAGGGRPAPARGRLHPGTARRHRFPHPLGPAGRHRLDRLGADHRQARRDLATGL